MTSCAMIAGMVPMAIGWGEQGGQTAPLGRAVIGGLAAATLATLFVLPTVFALVQGWAAGNRPRLTPTIPPARTTTKRRRRSVNWPWLAAMAMPGPVADSASWLILAAGHRSTPSVGLRTTDGGPGPARGRRRPRPCASSRSSIPSGTPSVARLASPASFRRSRPRRSTPRWPAT